MQSSIACRALVCGRRLKLQYDGYSRVVEVHAVGYSRGEQRGISMKMMVDAGANPEPLEFLSLLVLLLSRPVSRSSRLIGGGLGQLRTLRLINDMFYHTPPRPWEIGSPRLSPVPSSCPGY